MNAYYFVCFLTLLIQWIMPGETDKQYKLKITLSLVPLFLFGALRVDFGNDYPAYELFFESMHGANAELDSQMHAEVGFQLLCMIFPTYRTLLIFSSFLLCLSIGVFLYNYVPRNYVWFAFVLLFLNPQYNIHGNLVGLRHGIMTCCFLLSFVFVQKRKIIPFAIVTAALSFIHTSALFFLPIVYLIGRPNPISKREIVIWSVVLLILLALSMSSLYNVLARFVVAYFERYETYVASENNVHRGWLNLLAMTILLFSFLYTMYKRRLLLSGKANSIMRVGLLYCGLAFIGTLSMRGNLIYNMFFIASVCLFVSQYKKGDFFRVSIALLATAVSVYGMFVVWMRSPYWSHMYYHSLIGSW